MTPEEFEEALDELGVEHKRSGRSIVVKDCPACGSADFKVIFNTFSGGDGSPLLGKCLRGKCGEGYSSFKFFAKLGIGQAKNNRLHGKTTETAISEHDRKPDPDEFGVIAKEQKKQQVQPDTDLTKFMKISQWPDHPASKYAIRRGVLPDEHDFVLIDPINNAVVFVIKKNGKTVGYQRRFVHPYDPKMKTQTSYGFSRTKNILDIPNSGKILICEGPFTAIAAWHYGYHAVCTFGSSVSNEQLEQILAIGQDQSKAIAIAVENDDAGDKSFQKVLSYMYWLDVKVFEVRADKEFKDLNDAWVKGPCAPIYEVEVENHGAAIPQINMF
jgi:hypothetical protein